MSQMRTFASLAAVYRLPLNVPIFNAVIGLSPVGIDVRLAAPDKATPEEHKVLMGRIFDSRRSHARIL